MAEVVMAPSETRFQSEQPSFCSRLVLRIQTSDCVHRPSVHRSFLGAVLSRFKRFKFRGPTRSRCLVLTEFYDANEQTSEMGATVQWKLANLWIWGFIDGKQLPDCLIRLATSLLLSTFLLGNCHPDTVSPSWDVVEHPLNRKKNNMWRLSRNTPPYSKHRFCTPSFRWAAALQAKRKGTTFSKARSCYRNKLQWLLIPSFQSSCHGCYIMSGSKLPQLFFNILPTTSELWNL